MIGVRIRRKGAADVQLRIADDSRLQAVLDLACREFGDPSKVEPIPEPAPAQKPARGRQA